MTLPGWRPSRLVVLISLVHLAIPFARIFGGVEHINAFLTNDDTYYYLQTAWNTRHLGFVTFDGINPTNGVQFLWFAVLYAVSWLSPDKSTFLVIAASVGVILTWLPYVLILRMPTGGSMSRSLMSVLMAALWLVICLYEPNQYLVSMESVLHGLIIWTIVFQYSRIYRASKVGQVSSGAVLTFIVLLVLNTWTRLDSAGLSASCLALLLYTLAGTDRSEQRMSRLVPMSRRTAAAAAVIVAVGAVTPFGFFYLAGGSVLPVSALVKSYQVDRFSLGAFYNWSLVLFPLRIPGANLLNIFGILGLFASVAALVGMRRAAEDGNWGELRLAALALAAGVVVHSVITFGMFRFYYFWYLSASFVYWTIAFAIFLTALAGRKRWNPGRTALVATVSAILLVSVWAATTMPTNLAVTRYQVSKWANQNLEGDAILASFNAGQLGFFTDRSVINLDGLINNATYFETVLRSESPDALTAYLDRVGVDYVVDYQLGRWRDVIERRFTTIREFPLASGSAVRVMSRVTASRPSAP